MNFNVTPGNALGHSGPEGFGTGLLGRPALGEKSTGVDQPVGIFKLLRGEYAFAEAMPEARKRSVNSLNTDDVGANSDDHASSTTVVVSSISSFIRRIAAAKPTKMDSPTRK